MAQFYTLEEAARVLGMSPEELQAKAQHREVRAFLDGGSWRFRVADVDELARRRGLGSDADLQLSDLDYASPKDEKDLDLSEYHTGGGPLGQVTGEFSRSEKPGSGSDHDILLDDLSLPPNPVTGSSSVIIGMGRGGKLPGDSDVRLVPDNARSASDSDVRLVPDLGKGPSDSDVRLASPGDPRTPSDSDVTLIAKETSQRGHLGSGSGLGSGDTGVRQSPVGSSAEVPLPESDSDFELSPSSVADALQPQSGSDFELSALDGSDEFESTPLRKPGDSDVTAADPGLSGINLSRPSDSGINLMGSGGLNLGGASSIELSPLSSSEIKPGPKPAGKTSINPPAGKSKPSLSDTPPPGVRKGDKDIFDDTDFEVDALASDTDDSDDKTMQLEAASDFEIEESDTGSEVFAIDEADVDQTAATTIGSVAVDDEEADEFAEATSGEMASSAWDVESESATPSGRSAPAAVLASQGASAEWGGLWVGMLGVASVFMLLLAFVSMDLVRNLYEFRQDSPASGLVKSIAGMVAK
ncbi:MAG: hypothetical protein NVSMB9_03540 [Isosphaeraceae bacterium]